MDERRYLDLAAETFKKIEDAFDDVDPDLADVTPGGDVLTIGLRSGVKCVINTQRPVRQMWLAARANAYHFDWDEATRRWLDDRGRGIELGAQIAKIVEEESGVKIAVKL